MSFEFVFSESSLIPGVWTIKPNVSVDRRGDIWTSFRKEEIEKLLPSGVVFKHDKFSTSRKNVLRGIHGDEKSWKLVTCVYGDILEVVVDCRKESPTYLRHETFRIDGRNRLLVFIPPRMGNSYYVYSDVAVYYYKLAYEGDYIDADQQFSFAWNDPSIGIEWPTTAPILSDRDMREKQ